MADMEQKVEQYKAHLSRYFENPKEDKILYVFKKLERLEITLEILQSTGVGKIVNSFRKHEGGVGEKARQLVAKWKQLVSSTPSATATEKEPGSQPGLQCETVSETTYGSHSGRVAHRLDEVVKAPYLEGSVKVEPDSVRVKEEPHDNHKSRSSAEKHSKDKHQLDQKERGSKRDRTPESDAQDKTRKKHKHSHGNDLPDLSKVKKEKLESEGKIKVKKEPQEPSRSQDKHKQACDNSTKDRGRESSSKHSSHGSAKDDHHKHSKDLESSKDKPHKDRSKVGSSASTGNIFDKIKVKSEPLDKDNTLKPSSSKGSYDKVKVKKEHQDKRSDGDLHDVKVKLEPTESSKKSRKPEDTSRSKKHSSNSHQRTDSKGNTDSGRTSSDKGGSNHKDKSSSKSSESETKKREEKRQKSSSSKSSRSSSSGKKKKPVVAEFDMFSMPNGLEDDSEDESNSASFEDTLSGSASTSKKAQLPGGVKVKTEPSAKRSGFSKSVSSSAPRRLEAKLPGGNVPKPRQPMSLTQDDILSSLPETTPNYKPLPHIDFDSPSRQQELKVNDADIGSKKNCRTLVYSGRRNYFLTAVPSLYDACIQVLKDNIDSLDFVGGVPYDIMKPVLDICTPSQLYNIEDANPQFIGETDELWQAHCKKDFRKHQPEQFESWREMYIRCHDARDAKLKTLTASISASMVKAKEPVRKTQLAYVDTVAKAPREVRRRQRMHGTAGPMGKQDPLVKLSSHRSESAMPRPPVPRRMDANTSSSLGRSRSDKPVKVIAPMMRKTLRFMKSLKRK